MNQLLMIGCHPEDGRLGLLALARTVVRGEAGSGLASGCVGWMDERVLWSFFRAIWIGAIKL